MNRLRGFVAAIVCLLSVPARADVATDAATPAASETAPATTTALDAELRFRGAVSNHLKDLQVGHDDLRRGVFDRVRLGAEFRREMLRGYMQLQHAGAFGDAAPGSQPLMVGLQQGYVRWDVAGTRLRLDVGRMALAYGAERMIGRYDFHDTGNAFDGARLHLGLDVLDADLLAVKIRRNSTDPDRERNLAGLYATGKPHEKVRADLYFLYLHDRGESRASMTTMGARLDLRALSWLALEAEAALQVGDVDQPEHAALDHLATMAAGSVTFDATRWAPVQLQAHAHLFSGDAAPNDNVNRGWRPLYPSLDQVVGLLQLFNQTNLAQAGLLLRMQPTATWQGEIDAMQVFTRSGTTPPGLTANVLPGDGAWLRLGTEVDVRARWQPRPWTEVLAAAGIFVPADAVTEHVGTATAAQILLQWLARF